jgi:sugar lactone lactonase YvrE
MRDKPWQAEGWSGRAPGLQAWRAPGDPGDLLGEGPLWHPQRQELFWCDIEGRRIHRLDPALGGGETIPWPCRPSALGWVERDLLLVADEQGLKRLDLRDRSVGEIARFPASPGVRSNDGGADPWGGFWIGTMAEDAAPGRGALWRWTPRDGLRCLRQGLGVPNATAFAGRSRVFFADSLSRMIETAELDPLTGDPGEWTAFAQVPRPGLPDGATVDAAGCLWNAEWDGARLLRYAPDGGTEREVDLPVPRPTCPAFGGPGMRTLFVTTARTGLSAEALAAAPLSGAVLALDAGVEGVPEPPVRL